jgi:glycosyltransferase involved in cell wall biosynthesis
MHYFDSTDSLRMGTPLTKQRPIRILQVVGAMNRGGIETWLMNVVRTIDRNRFQMDFLVHTTELCAYDREILALGCRIIPCLHPSQPWFYGRNFRRILREYGPYDIVQGQLHLFSGYTLRLAAQEKVPVRIAHVHAFTDVHQHRPFRSVYQKLMTRWLSQYTTHVITPSKSSLHAFQKICDCSNKDTDILYNGIDLARFNKVVDRVDVRQKFNLPIDKALVIYVARFTAHKNHLQMLRIADRLNHTNSPIHFVMVGSHGELLQTLREKVEERNNISMLTGIADISELLNAADLFFFPSLEEGFGVVALEAAAAGLPVVATNLPTIREACAPSHHPFMFAANDDQAASRSILKILQDKSLKEQLANYSRQWAANFSISKSVNQLSSLYESIT